MKKRNKTFFEKNKTGLIVLVIALGIITAIFGVGMLSGASKIDNLDNQVFGDDAIELIYFHWNQCPHCHKQNEFMENVLLEQYPNLKIVQYEITQPGTKEKYEEYAQLYDQLPNSWSQFPGTPTSIIGDRINTGYDEDSTTGQLLIEMIEEEKAKIEANWDDETMIRTSELRTQVQ
jgi:glutaredoxin